MDMNLIQFVTWNKPDSRPKSCKNMGMDPIQFVTWIKPDSMPESCKIMDVDPSKFVTRILRLISEMPDSLNFCKEFSQTNTPKRNITLTGKMKMTLRLNCMSGLPMIVVHRMGDLGGRNWKRGRERDWQFLPERETNDHGTRKVTDSKLNQGTAANGTYTESIAPDIQSYYIWPLRPWL